MFGLPFLRRDKKQADVASEVREIDDTSWDAIGRSYASRDTDLAPAVTQAVLAVSEAIAALPPKLMRCEPNGQKQIVESTHEAWQYLRRPCSWLGWSSWVSTIMQDVLLRGNGYAVIDGDQLIPVSDVSCHSGYSQLVYDVSYNFPYPKRKNYRVSSDMVLHFRNAFLDSFKLCGRSNLEMTPSLKELAKSMTSALLMSYRQGVYPSLVLQLNDEELDEETSERIQKKLEEKFSARKAFQKPMILGRNVEAKDVKPLGNRESQLETSRAALVADIARTFNVPQTNLNLLEHSTLANVSEYNKMFFRSIQSHIVRFQETFSNALLEDDIQLVLDTQSLTHGDILDRQKQIIEMFKVGIFGDINSDEAKETARRLLDV